MQKVIATNGMKAANFSDNGIKDSWDFVDVFGSAMPDELYARVAAMYRAFNLKANTVGNMPFALYQGKTEFDASATWENKVKFLPNPSELLRLDTLSFMATNTIYNLRTSDVLGYRTKGLYHTVAATFHPVTNPTTSQLAYIERYVGSQREEYQPEDKRLVRMWRLDHTTEVLPSPNTEARAIAAAAGIVYYHDAWIENFFHGGGIKPTLIAMKGLVDKDTKEEKEKSWSEFLRGVGKWFKNRARIYNAESMEATPFGSGIDDLKDSKTFEQALSSIAMGTGMPLSLLMANSANYATAKEEKATWYENDIIPLCNWIAYEYNRQVFEPLGLRLEFHPETLDPQQEDETERAQAFSTYMDAMSKCPTYELFDGWCETMGLEISEKLDAAAKKYYTDKEKQAEETRQQMQSAGVVVGPDGKPIQQKPEEKPTDKPQEQPKEDPEDDEEDKPAKWFPSIDELEELRIWREIMQRRCKKGQSLDYEYKPKAVELPQEVRSKIKQALSTAKTEEEVKAAFELSEVKEPQSDILVLAASLNKLAEVQQKG